ncbi:hypothetical protein NPIL_268861 [Nephila pilipes]|uniref:Uncharacterized protein n=1 Tax=Nephila pilipes TaxID=299642 RepID=A0A8X6NKA0_NEPPI|nr:hypothetical protein NPIL_268861 [Nephila pilipes]
MYQVFKDKGLIFLEIKLTMSLADGQQTTGEALKTQVMVEIERRSVLTKFIILPKTKENRIMLLTDFLSSAGLVLDVKNACWCPLQPCGHGRKRRSIRVLMPLKIDSQN